MLAEENLQPRAGGQAEAYDSELVLDMDSTESPVHGQQEGSAYNGHFEWSALLLFNQHGRRSCVPATCTAPRTGMSVAGDRAPTGCGQAGRLPGGCSLCQARDL